MNSVDRAFTPALELAESIRALGSVAPRNCQSLLGTD